MAKQLKLNRPAVLGGALVLLAAVGFFYFKDQAQAATVRTLCETEMRQRLPKTAAAELTDQKRKAKGAFNLLTATVTSTTEAHETEHYDLLCVVHGREAQAGMGAQEGGYNLYKLVLAPR